MKWSLSLLIGDRDGHVGCRTRMGAMVDLAYLSRWNPFQMYHLLCYNCNTISSNAFGSRRHASPKMPPTVPVVAKLIDACCVVGTEFGWTIFYFLLSFHISKHNLIDAWGTTTVRVLQTYSDKSFRPILKFLRLMTVNLSSTTTKNVSSIVLKSLPAKS